MRHLGGRRPPGGAAGGLGATFPATQSPHGPGQEADPALLPRRKAPAGQLPTSPQAKAHWGAAPGMAEPGRQDNPILRHLRNHDRVPRERGHCGWRYVELPRPTVPTGALCEEQKGQRRESGSGEGLGAPASRSWRRPGRDPMAPRGQKGPCPADLSCGLLNSDLGDTVVPQP